MYRAGPAFHEVVGEGEGITECRAHHAARKERDSKPSTSLAVHWAEILGNSSDDYGKSSCGIA